MSLGRAFVYREKTLTLALPNATMKLRCCHLTVTDAAYPTVKQAMPATQGFGLQPEI